MKRRAEAEVGGGRDKVSRGGGAEGEVEEGDGRPWEKRAGMIMEVKLRNFMCHEVFILSMFSMTPSRCAAVHLLAEPAAELPVWTEWQRQVRRAHCHRSAVHLYNCTLTSTNQYTPVYLYTPVHLYTSMLGKL